MIGGPLTTIRALSILLDRRARHRAIGTENAAIARKWFEALTAALAVVEKLTRIGWHLLRRLMSAFRTCENALGMHQRDVLTIRRRDGSNWLQLAAVRTRTEASARAIAVLRAPRRRKYKSQEKVTSVALPTNNGIR